MTKDVGFDSVQHALQQLNAMTDAAEAHGTLCGLLMGRQEFSKWLDYTLDKFPDTGDLLAREQLRVLQKLYEQSKLQLNADDMSLQLLLPGDDDEFAFRLSGLALWCQGFLYGLAVNGELFLNALSEQGRECMDDLLQISKLERNEEESEESETVYTEILEHVRISVIYIHEEINPVLPSPTVQQ